MIELDIDDINLRLKKEAGKTYVYDPVRKKWVVLTPEEHVRQYLLQYLLLKLQYPASLIAVEKQITLGTQTKRFDIAVYSRDHIPWLLAECKAPEVSITDSTLQQLLRYHNSMQCNYWLISNGHQTFCANACNVQDIQWMNELPAYGS